MNCLYVYIRFVIQFILKVMSPVVYTQVKKLLETEFGGDTVTFVIKKRYQVGCEST